MTICEGGSGRFRACRFKTEESIKTAGAQQNSLLNSGHHKYGILAFCTELSDLSDLYAELASPPLLIQTNLRTWKQASLLTAELSRDHARLTDTWRSCISNSIVLRPYKSFFLFLASW